MMLFRSIFSYAVVMCLVLSPAFAQEAVKMEATGPIQTPQPVQAPQPDAATPAQAPSAIPAPPSTVTPPAVIAAAPSTIIPLAAPAGVPVAPAASSVPVPQVSPASKDRNRNTAKGTIVVPSLFYTPEERDAIERAKMQYAGGTPEETEADLLDQLNGIKAASKKSVEEPQETAYAQFYLVSLAFHQPDNWVLWFKDLEGVHKLDPESNTKPDQVLKVVNIAAENVEFEWSPKNWPYVTHAFKPNTPNIAINPNRQLVRFTVRVNQTFDSSDMEVKEGVVAPVTLAPVTPAPTDADGKPLPADAANDKQAPAPPAETPEPKPVGILDQYNNLQSVK